MGTNLLHLEKKYMIQVSIKISIIVSVIAISIIVLVWKTTLIIVISTFQKT